MRWQRHARTVQTLAFGALLLAPAGVSEKSRLAAPLEQWEMSLEGGRKLTWERTFSSEAEVKPNRGFWNKLVDVVVGAPEFHPLIRPYSLVADSRGRIIVSDPGASGVHIFDFAQHKYKFIHRGVRDQDKDAMLTPQCVAVDAQDRIYVSDSEAGVIFVFDSTGKHLRTIGRLKGGEGYFKRPTGIAVDSATQRIYVTDTLRDDIFILDFDGNVLQTFGKSGKADGEFDLPTEIRLDGPNLIVVDAMNFRVQVFDRSGKFQFALGKPGSGMLFRPKGVAVDSEGHIYIVDAERGLVQVFDREGELLYYFGASGTHAGQFQLPSGLFIDPNDQVYVADSYNRRIQVFQYTGLKPAIGGGSR